MTISFHKAKREDTKLLLAMAGPSGSGKTYSALRVATGIVSVTGGKIAFIDTENKRALLNAPSGDENGFDFEHGNLERPFSSDAYREAIDAAEAVAGEDGVVIIDSLSHEHVGPGGYLSWHDQEVERLCERAKEKNGGRYVDPDKYNYPAWAKPAAARLRLIDQLLRCKSHLIVCFRAKEKTKLIKGQIADAGWQPLTGDDYPYDMTTFCLLNPTKKGVPIFDDFEHGKLPEKLAPLVQKGKQLDEAFGQRFAKWAAAAQKPAQAPSASDKQSGHTDTENGSPRSEGAAVAEELGIRRDPPELVEDDDPGFGGLDDQIEHAKEIEKEESIQAARRLWDVISKTRSTDKISDLVKQVMELGGKISDQNLDQLSAHLEAQSKKIREAEKAA